MRTRISLVQLLFTCVLLGPLLGFSQSGWTQPRHGLFVKADVSVTSATRYFTSLGNDLETNPFRAIGLSAYAEYGLHDRVTLIGQAPLLKAHAYSTTRPVIGQGDLAAHIKYRFTKLKWPVAASLGVELPTGRANASAEDKVLPGVLINLPTGDGELNFWGTLAGSKSFGKFYATLFTAYNLRTQYDGKAFRDLVQVGGELGYQPGKKLWLNLKARTQLSLGEGQHPELSFVRGDASTFSVVSGEAYYKALPNWGFSAGVAVPSGLLVPFRNVYAAPTFSLGVAFQK
jgi:hypothetical protein